VYYRVRAKGAATQYLRAERAIPLAANPLLRPQRGIAMARVAFAAGRALIAWSAIGDYYGITHSKVRNAFADLLNNSRAFVAQNNRERHAVTIQCFYGEIGVANSAGHQANQNLIWPWSIYGDIFYLRRRTGLIQQDRLALN
jgi:hypothetical protein